MLGVPGLLNVGPVLPGSWEAHGSFIVANFTANGPGFQHHAVRYAVEGVVFFNYIIIYAIETEFSVFRVLEYGVGLRQF